MSLFRPLLYQAFSTSRRIIQDWCLRENQYYPGTMNKASALSHWSTARNLSPPNITELAQEAIKGWETEVQKEEASVNPFCQRAVFYVEKRKIEGNAVEVGPGFSSLTPIFLRLNRKVFLIDPCKGSLDLVVKNIKAQGLNQENLTVTVGKVENYTFPEKNSIIVLQDVLPYCDPKEMLNIFQRMHTSLTAGGLVTGNFFYHDPNRGDPDYMKRELICRFNLGATFMTDEVAKAFIQELGFTIMEYGTDGHRLYFTLKK